MAGAGDPFDGKPHDDAEELAWLLGKYALVGMTYLNAGGQVVKQAQCHGRIVRVDKGGVTVTCEGETWKGEEATFPPDLRAYSPADPGQYTLRTTGEIVVDPDVLATWSVTQPETH